MGRFGRLMAWAACLLVAGCYGSVSPYGGDGDTVGDPGWDPGIDTNHDPDADPPVDTPDSYCDPCGDEIPDGVPCWSATADYGGVCSVIDQCGCPAGAWCTWNLSVGCLLFEDCYGGDAGTHDVGEECSGHDPAECRPGTECLPYGSASLCYEWCMDDADCSLAGTTCTVPVSFALPPPCAGSATAPYMACSTVCPPDVGCDPLAEGTCGSGNACTWDPVCDKLVCAPAGTGLPGDPCVDIGCAEGSGCYWTTTEPETLCYQFCDATASEPSCSTGACQAIGSMTHPDLGVCTTP